MQVLASKDFRAPVLRYENVSFFHARANNMYVVAATRMNVNAAMVFQFVFQIVALVKSYFGGQFDEDILRENFTLIYELIDEVLDFGYPQNMSPDMLKTYIVQEGFKLDTFLLGKVRNPPPSCADAEVCDAGAADERCAAGDGGCQLEA